jgi:hypothetical protein
MGKIKSYSKFIDENVGYGIVGQVGVGYGETGLQNKTVNSHDTNEIFCDIDDKFYNIDDYNNIYQEYLKTPVGSKNPLDGFTLDNIVAILQVINPESFK